MPLIANSKRDIILAALAASGMTEAEAVAFLTPAPKATRKLEDMDGSQVVPLAIARAKTIGASLAGMTPGDVLSATGLKHAAKVISAEDEGTVVGILEAELAAGTLPKLRRSKKGTTSPTSAIVNLMWLKAMIVKSEG